MVLRPQGFVFFRTHHLPPHAQDGLLSAEDFGIDSRGHETRLWLHPRPARDGIPHGARVLSDGPGSSHDDLSSGLRRGHFPPGARHVHPVPFDLRHRLHRGSADRRRPRQRAPQGAHRAHYAHLPGRRHLRFRPLRLGLAELLHAIRLRSIPHRGLRPGEFPAAAHHYQRTPRPRDEHLRLCVPRRHAHGKPVDRLARPTVFGPYRARRERTRPDGCSSVFPHRATAGRPLLVLLENNIVGIFYTPFIGPPPPSPP